VPNARPRMGEIMKLDVLARASALGTVLIAGQVFAAVGEGHLFAGIVHESAYFSASVSYATPNGQGDAMTANVRAAMLMPIACTGGSLNAALNSVDATYTGATVTVMLNGVATGSTCALAGAASTCNDTTHTFAVAAGDNVSLQIAPALPQRAITNVDTDIKVKLPFSWRCVE
jgi:hypothetical protein